MEQILHITIGDPPTKFIIPNKKGKLDKDGEVKKDTVIYLSNNVFYGGVHFSVRNKVVDYFKDWMFPFMQGMPKLDRCTIEITYHQPTDMFDLDNKVGFIAKILLDVLKTPSSKQIITAQKYKRSIVTLNVLPDDSVRYVDEIVMRYKKGASAIEIKICGIKNNDQGNLFENS